MTKIHTYYFKKKRREKQKPILLDSLPQKFLSLLIREIACMCGGLKICPHYLILLPSKGGA